MENQDQTQTQDNELVAAPSPTDAPAETLDEGADAAPEHIEIEAAQAISGVTISFVDQIVDEHTLKLDGYDRGDGSAPDYVLSYQGEPNEDGSPNWVPVDTSEGANADMMQQSIIPAAQAQGYTYCKDVYVSVVVTPFQPESVAQPVTEDLPPEQDVQPETAAVDPLDAFSDRDIFAAAFKRMGANSDRLALAESRLNTAYDIMNKLNTAIMTVAGNIDGRFRDLFSNPVTLTTFSNRLKAVQAAPWIYDAKTISESITISRDQLDSNSIRITIAGVTENNVDGVVAAPDGNGGWTDLGTQPGGYEIANFLVAKAVKEGIRDGVAYANFAPPAPVAPVAANDAAPAPAPVSVTDTGLNEAPDINATQAAPEVAPVVDTTLETSEERARGIFADNVAQLVNGTLLTLNVVTGPADISVMGPLPAGVTAVRSDADTYTLTYTAPVVTAGDTAEAATTPATDTQVEQAPVEAEAPVAAVDTTAAASTPDAAPAPVVDDTPTPATTTTDAAPTSDAQVAPVVDAAPVTAGDVATLLNGILPAGMSADPISAAAAPDVVAAPAASDTAAPAAPAAGE